MVLKTFADHIRAALDKGLITEKGICHEFGISKPTFKRWMKGKNGPHPTMQHVIFKYIKDKS